MFKFTPSHFSNGLCMQQGIPLGKQTIHLGKKPPGMVCKCNVGTTELPEEFISLPNEPHITYLGDSRARFYLQHNNWETPAKSPFFPVVMDIQPEAGESQGLLGVNGCCDRSDCGFIHPHSDGGAESFVPALNGSSPLQYSPRVPRGH